MGKVWTVIDMLPKIWKSDLFDKINTIVEISHLELNEALGEKAWWELNKNAVCCSEYILEVTPYKTAAILPLTTNLTNYPSTMNMTSWTLLEKQGRTHKWRSFSGFLHLEVSVLAKQQKTYKYQLCADTGCRLEDLPKVMANKDGWYERVVGIHTFSTW